MHSVPVQEPPWNSITCDGERIAGDTSERQEMGAPGTICEEPSGLSRAREPAAWARGIMSARVWTAAVVLVMFVMVMIEPKSCAKRGRQRKFRSRFSSKRP
jgi:hypothetical protein